MGELKERVVAVGGLQTVCWGSDVVITRWLPGDLPDPGIEPGSPALQAESLPAEL